MSTLPISNLGFGQTSYPLYNDPAYAGLKLDLATDLVGSRPYVQTDAITPGLVLAFMSDGSVALPSVAAAGSSVLAAGVFVRDATLTGVPQLLFSPFSPLLPEVLSIMSRGGIWAQVTTGGSATVDAPVRFAGDGTVGSAGAYLLPHATFLSGPMTLHDGSQIVQIQLHSPLAA